MDTRRIALGRTGEHVAIVSAEDYEWLTQWLWTFKRSSWQYGALIYARRHQRIQGVRTTILMHTLILTERMGEPRPSDKHSVDHFPDRNTLNNTRENLRWATRSEQEANKRQKITTLGRAIYDNIADTF